MTGYTASQRPNEMEFRLWELIFALGIHLNQRFEPSIRNKLFDFDHLIEKISTDEDFKILITEIRNDLDSEVLGEISKMVGVGISILILKNLFHTPLNSIQRIKTNTLRHDYLGATDFGHSIGLESKGSSRLSTLTQLTKHGVLQKNTSQANIKTVVGTLINENTRSVVNVIDPPGDYELIDEITLYSRKAINLSSLFDFLGHLELSKYFKLMSKRILSDEYQTVAYDKELLYEKINNEYNDYVFKGIRYKGTFTKFNKEIVFTGINSNAIGFYDFIDKNNWKLDLDYKDDNAIIYQGKILIRQLDFSEYQKYIQVSDIYFSNINIKDFQVSSSSIGRKLLIDLFNFAGLKVKILTSNYILLGEEQSLIIIYRKFFYKKGTFLEREILNIFKKAFDVSPVKNPRVIILTPTKLEFEGKYRGEILDSNEFEFLIESLKNNIKSYF